MYTLANSNLLIYKFKNDKKLGEDELIEQFRTKLENDINIQFITFERQNDAARRRVEVSSISKETTI